MLTPVALLFSLLIGLISLALPNLGYLVDSGGTAGKTAAVGFAQFGAAGLGVTQAVPVFSCCPIS